MGSVTINMQIVRNPSLNLFKGKNKMSGRRALFLFSEKFRAGMALEGCLVLPLFLFFMMTVLLSLEIVRFQSQVQEALFQAGNRSAFLEYQVKYTGMAREDAGRQVREYLGNQVCPYLCVRDGETGVSLKNLSVSQKGEIVYQAAYHIKPFITLLPIGDILINDRFYSHAWTGYQGTEAWGNESRKEIYVYITDTGSRYHLQSGCTYLHVRVQAINHNRIGEIRNESGGKYYPCERCRPPREGIVYITSDGNCFHGQSDCPALKRTIYMIPLSQASAYSPCRKCAGG